jgi:hypothetical protein
MRAHGSVHGMETSRRPHPRRAAAARFALLALAAALALTACGPANSTPTEGTGTMTPNASGAASQETAELLIDSAIADAEALMRVFPGQWTGLQGTPWNAADYRDGLNPQRCADPQVDVFHFELALRGPGQPDPEQALAAAQAYLADRGYTLREGSGVGPGDNATASGIMDNGRRAVVDAGPGEVRLQVQTQCSGHESLADLQRERLDEKESSGLPSGQGTATAERPSRWGIRG